MGKPRKLYQEQHGYETLNGSGVITGKLYGGCIESIYDDLIGNRYGDEPYVFEKYNIFSTNKEWKDKILF